MEIERDLKRVMESKIILEEHKPLIEKLLTEANKIKFRTKGRTDVYSYKDLDFPRCTVVLKMDGTKAEALMEWAKREVVNKMQDILIDFADDRIVLDRETIAELGALALAEPDKQRDQAADKGTLVHDNIEKWLNGDAYEENEQLSIFRNIWLKENYTLIATEIPIVWYNIDKGFGGRLDILAYRDGKFYILDNKTSKSLHQGYGMQVGAYAKAVEQMSGIKTEGASIVHLPDTSVMKEYQLKEFKRRGNLVALKDLDKAFNHFLILLEQYYNRNNKYF